MRSCAGAVIGGSRPVGGSTSSDVRIVPVICVP
jgi:hypothetical protein